MSLENEDRSSVVEAESRKKPRIAYTRDFLLSLSELEICKRLPSGFDRSLLSEFEDASHGIQDRSRGHGSLPVQGFRRGDYSSSPPTRGDSGNFPRGVYGRWDSRSSGWSDKDGDSQPDFDSDSGRHTYVNPSRRSWKNSEHDGLLGSGSFPRPSGYAAGVSALKGQTNEPYQLNRSNERYHPPRPFKAEPYSRISTNDSLNDETFGSSECTSQDRAEEERKRRASFELMRKEQQKVLQEKQKMNANNHESDCFTDLALEEAKEKGFSEVSGELDFAVLSVSNNDSGKSSFSSQSSKSRPLVPPGFRSTILEKSSTGKPLISSTEKENPKPEVEEIHFPVEGRPFQNGTLDDQGKMQAVHKLDIMEQHPEDKNSRGLKMDEAIMGSSSGSVVSSEKLGIGDHHMYRISGLPEVHEAVGGGGVFKLMSHEVTGKKTDGNSSQESTTSILEKLFGSAPASKVGGTSGFVEQQESKPVDSRSPRHVQSSKFAQWFDEDEMKPMDDLSSSRPNDLLSLIVGGEKSGSQAPNIISTEPTPLPSDSEHLYNNNRREAAPPVPVVLTCEDLEQTILSEYSEKVSASQPPVPEWSISGQENIDAKAVDNHATHHLLSLLQKGTSPGDVIPSNINVEPSEMRPASETCGVTTCDKPKDANAKDIHNSGQSLTLETLFGTAFMKELQSAEAPVSVQRGSAGPARTDVLEPRGSSVPVTNDDPFSSAVDGIGSKITNHESDLFVSKQKQFDGPQADVDSLDFQSEVPKSPKQAVDGAEIQLPEEESLFTVGDPANTTRRELLPSDVTFDIAEKLAALNSGFRGERSTAPQEDPRFVRGPYDLLEPGSQLNNLQAQMNHDPMTRFHPLDPHSAYVNSQMRFPEHLTQHDTSPNHQFLANMLRPFHHPDTRVTGFDVPAHHQMLPQMQMPGNFPPNLLHDFPRPSPVPPHPRNQATNFLPDTEAMHGFAFGHRQPNIGGLRMPLPGPDASSRSNNHPEAFQRIMEMGLRTHPKQIQPLNAGHGQGTYGHGLDMGSRYR